MLVPCLLPSSMRFPARLPRLAMVHTWSAARRVTAGPRSWHDGDQVTASMKSTTSAMAKMPTAAASNTAPSPIMIRPSQSPMPPTREAYCDLRRSTSVEISASQAAARACLPRGRAWRATWRGAESPSENRPAEIGRIHAAGAVEREQVSERLTGASPGQAIIDGPGR